MVVVAQGLLLKWQILSTPAKLACLKLTMREKSYIKIDSNVFAGIDFFLGSIASLI
jgi:hypothetical protein